MQSRRCGEIPKEASSVGIVTSAGQIPGIQKNAAMNGSHVKPPQNVYILPQNSICSHHVVLAVDMFYSAIILANNRQFFHIEAILLKFANRVSKADRAIQRP